MKRAALLLLTALPLVAAKDDPFAGRVAGKPERCLNTTVTSRGGVIVDDTTIFYRDGPRLWRTGPRGSCPALRPNATLIVEIWGGQLCSGDRFRVLEPGVRIPSGACLFRDFVPYTRPPAPPASQQRM
ncbi:hypothetical protein [Sphingomonas sp.]|uniref:hypothetical protein n=1 Tax=Sphingomonas sp. TaxID=28214 RepID=UPI0035C7FD74